MRQLNKLFLLVHGLCYAEMAFGRPVDSEARSRYAPFIEREVVCAAGWRSRLQVMGDNEALVIIPPATAPGRPAHDFNEAATTLLGDRCFVLQCPEVTTAAFWRSGDDAFRRALFGELQDACVGQHLRANPEELATDFHCLACCFQLEELLRKRGFVIDAATLAAQGWGASFEGCVLKYSIAFRRLLKLAQPVVIDFHSTVPDAAFLLDASASECIHLHPAVRLFLFQQGTRYTALFTRLEHSLADEPALAILPRFLEFCGVRSKQGVRLWPDPQAYEMAAAPLGFRESSQVVVASRGGRLAVPVSAGFVYRLAKAPAYIVAPPGMSYFDFRTALLEADFEHVTMPVGIA